MCVSVCVFTSQRTHTAQKQINNIRLFASHARPQVIQDFWQSVNNLPSNGGEILMMCLRAWVSAQNWRRVNISQSTRKLIIQPLIQKVRGIPTHRAKQDTCTRFLWMFLCLSPCFCLKHTLTHLEETPHISVYEDVTQQERLTQRLTLKSTSNEKEGVGLTLLSVKLRENYNKGKNIFKHTVQVVVLLR